MQYQRFLQSLQLSVLGMTALVSGSLMADGLYGSLAVLLTGFFSGMAYQWFQNASEKLSDELQDDFSEK